MRVRTALLSLTLAAALPALPGLASPASAAAPAGAAVGATAAAADSTCTFTRTLCLWENQNYGGARFTVSALNPAVGTCVDLAWHGWGAGRAESARNTAGQSATLYPTTNCTGSGYTIPPGSSVPTIGFVSNSVYVY